MQWLFDGIDNRLIFLVESGALVIFQGRCIVAVFIQPPVVELDGSLPFSPVPYVAGVAHVAILMCTYNGGTFLAEQLESFERQSHRNWSLHVSDDGSKVSAP